MRMPDQRTRTAAFSLIEVMVAVAIFFGGLFAILMVVSNCLADARHLERPLLDASVVASYMSQTNKLVEGGSSGDLGDLLGDTYNGNPWTAEVLEAETNKLFAMHIVLHGKEANKSVESEMTILLYRPQSPAGSLEGATMHR